MKFLLFLLLLPVVLQAQYAAPFQKNSKWSKKKIRVCFESSSARSEIFRRATREAAESSWERHSGLDFTDWCTCTGPEFDIRILIVDDLLTRPHAKRLGALLAGLTSGVVLNTNWFRLGCGSLSYDKMLCFKAVAIHELGHAIGFNHEHANPNCCQPLDMGGSDLIDPTSDDWIKSEVCDETSIMSYCNKLYCNGGTLSPMDISLVQRVYGKRSAVDGVIISEAFNMNSSNFRNHSHDVYSTYFTKSGRYALKMDPGVWGFTWIGLPAVISNAFSSEVSTVLEFEFEIGSFDKRYYSVGLMFDLHDVDNTINCMGGNFYLLGFTFYEDEKTATAQVRQRTDCKNSPTWKHIAGNTAVADCSSKINKMKIVKMDRTYDAYINGVLVCSFIYSGYLNFSNIYFTSGISYIDNMLVVKI